MAINGINIDWQVGIIFIPDGVPKPSVKYEQCVIPTALGRSREGMDIMVEWKYSAENVCVEGLQKSVIVFVHRCSRYVLNAASCTVKVNISRVSIDVLNMHMLFDLTVFPNC